MGTEVIIYGYGLVCLSMLIFNIVYSFYLSSDQRRLERKVERIAGLVNEQMQQVQPLPDQPLPDQQLQQMERFLSRVGNLLAFEQFLDQADNTKWDAKVYLAKLQPAFLRLAQFYSRQEETKAAYFCHFLAIYPPGEHRQMDPLQQELLGYLSKKSIYCRANALRALCAFGCVESVVDALLLLNDRPGAQLHNKVLVEILLGFQGDSDELVQALWRAFERFPVQTQRALLDYIRFESGDYCEQMLHILTDTGRDKELRLAAVRYFGRYPYEPARQLLISFAKEQDQVHWEYAAVAASCLARYPGKDVLQALSVALHSPNWYVRYNAAASLEILGLTYEQLLQVAGNDRFAREMLTYRLESREMLERKKSDKQKEVPAGV